MSSHNPTQSELGEVAIPKAEYATAVHSLDDSSAKADATEITLRQGANASSPIVTEVSVNGLAKGYKPVGVSEGQKKTAGCSTDTTLPSQSHVSKESRIEDSQPEIYDANKMQVVTTGRQKKRTVQEQRNLENAVTQELQDGHPVQAIALRLKISLVATEKILVKLIQGGNQEQIVAPKYDVVKSGVKIKDLQLLDSTDADFFKVERHSNGILIKPFNITENENV